jgi:hypothetical protein
MSTASATVSLANLSGSPLVWQDTGSYGTIVSRTLVITDYEGNVLENVSLGATLTYDFTISADAWFCFTGTIVDNTGTYTSVVYYVSTGFYWATYLEQFTSTNCGCTGVNRNLELSQLQLQAALRFNLAGASGAAAAQNCIIMANYFVNQSITAQLA